MRLKNRVLTVVTVSFFSLLFVSTFLSKSIYYYTHERVTVVNISNGFINNEFENISAKLILDGGDNVIFPVKLKEPLVIKKIMVSKTEYIDEGSVILSFDPASVIIARNYLLAEIENCESGKPVNLAELAALEEKLRQFDSHIDKNGYLLSSKSGFITDIYLQEGDNFVGSDQLYCISNEETDYRIGLDFSLDQIRYIDSNCELTLQKEDTLIKGSVHNIVYNEEDCSVIVQPSTTITEEAAMQLFVDNIELPMNINTSSGRYDIIVPAEAIRDNQYIYVTNTTVSFLGRRTLAEKINVQIKATNGELVAVDAKNLMLQPDSKVITSESKLSKGEEIVVKR